MRSAKPSGVCDQASRKQVRERGRAHACFWPCLSGRGVRHNRPTGRAADATPHGAIHFNALLCLLMRRLCSVPVEAASTHTRAKRTSAVWPWVCGGPGALVCDACMHECMCRQLRAWCPCLCPAVPPAFWLRPCGTRARVLHLEAPDSVAPISPRSLCAPRMAVLDRLAAFFYISHPRILDLNVRSCGAASCDQSQRPDTAAGWDYDAMIAKLRAGVYAAVISDDMQLLPRAYADDTCSLHLLKETIEPFDLALAFSKSFPSDAFREDVSGALLDMQEDGTISVRPSRRKRSLHAWLQVLRAVVGVAMKATGRYGKHGCPAGHTPPRAALSIGYPDPMCTCPD